MQQQRLRGCQHGSQRRGRRPPTISRHKIKGYTGTPQTHASPRPPPVALLARHLRDIGGGHGLQRASYRRHAGAMSPPSSRTQYAGSAARHSCPQAGVARRWQREQGGGTPVAHAHGKSLASFTCRSRRVRRAWQPSQRCAVCKRRVSLAALLSVYSTQRNVPTTASIALQPRSAARLQHHRNVSSTDAPGSDVVAPRRHSGQASAAFANPTAVAALPLPLSTAGRVGCTSVRPSARRYRSGVPVLVRCWLQAVVMPAMVAWWTRGA